jgi:hypothetical protein
MGPTWGQSGVNMGSTWGEHGLKVQPPNHDVHHGLVAHGDGGTLLLDPLQFVVQVLRARRPLGSLTHYSFS